MSIEPIILLHGGAGDIPDSRVPLKLAGLKKAAMESYSVLLKTACVLNAIEAAVKIMEDDEAFNAGNFKYFSIVKLSIYLGTNYMFRELKEEDQF
jgi:beta-aspartyl-peptidase (threonine type)